MNITPIAHIENDFKEKFGIPRQSGLTGLPSKIVFEPNFRDVNALRGMDDFTHIWLIWGFSEVKPGRFSPTVRPPRLGGNVRKGVFATRSPFRPNPLGLSLVKILEILPEPAIIVSGADLMDGSPIYDIKPYLPYTESVPEASNGWSLSETEGKLKVKFPDELLELIPENKRKGLTEALAQDPRPQYQNSPNRIYIMSFAGFQVCFKIEDNLLTVVDVKK